MTTLKIRKAAAKPTAPYTPSCLYLVPKEDGIKTPHRAWRVRFQDRPNNTRITFLDFYKGSAAHTMFGNSILGGDLGGTVSAEGSGFVELGSTLRVIGAIFSTPQKITQFRMESTTNQGNWPFGWILEYSDDTTNGTDGLWLKTWEDPHPNAVQEMSVTSEFYDQGELLIFMSSEDGGSITELPSSDNLQRIIDRYSKDHILDFDTYATVQAVKSSIAGNVIVRVEDASAHPQVITGSAYMTYDKSDDEFSIVSPTLYSGSMTNVEW